MILSKPQIIGISFLGIATFLFASNFIVGEYASALINPWQLAFLRFLIAFFILLPLTGRAVWRYRLAIWHNKWILFWQGLMGVALSGSFGYKALISTPAIDGGFIFTAAPLMILLLSYFLLHEKLNKNQLIGLIIMLLGILYIIFRGNIKSVFTLKFSQGDLWMVGNAFVYAVFTILVRKYKTHIPSLAALLVMLFWGLLCLAPVALLSWHTIPIPSLASIKIWSVIFYAGIFTSALAYLFYIIGTAQAGSKFAAIFTYLIPLFVALQACIILKSPLYLYQIISAALIIIGLIIIFKHNK